MFDEAVLDNPVKTDAKPQTDTKTPLHEDLGTPDEITQSAPESVRQDLQNALTKEISSLEPSEPLNTESVTTLKSETVNEPRSYSILSLMAGAGQALKAGDIQLRSAQDIDGIASRLESASKKLLSDDREDTLRKFAAENGHSPDSPPPLDITQLKLSDLDHMLDRLGLRPEDLDVIDKWQDQLEIYESKMEPKYGVLRYPEMRKRTAQMIERGASGAWLELDIVGLKIFNTYGKVEYGDQSILRSVDFLKGVLTNRFQLSNPELYISRQGDSGFMFVPGHSQQEVIEAFNQEYERNLPQLEMKVDPRHNQGQETTLPIRYYYDAVNVGPNPDSITQEGFDATIDDLSRTIEDNKAGKMVEVAKAIVDMFPEAPVTRFMLALNYISQKRIAQEVIDIIIDASYEAVPMIDRLTNLTMNIAKDDQERANKAKGLLHDFESSADISTQLREIIERVTLGDPQNIRVTLP